MNRKKTFVVVSIIILCLDATFVLINYFYSKELLNKSLIGKSEALHTAYNTELESTYENLLLIATLYAENEQIQDLFLKGKIAVEKEGGGAGKNESDHFRQLLLKKTLPAWDKAKDRFNVRQLHFHLGPGDTSFLRVHRPEKYGDNMDDIRFTIVDTNKEKTSRTGFETGRVYSGLRGVVPVFSASEGTFIGTLEVGTSFTSMFKHIDNNFDAGIAILLKKSHLKKYMWPDFIEKRFGDGLEVCDCVIEASSRPNAEEIISISKSTHSINSPDGKIKFLKVGDKYFFSNFYPLNDYIGSKNNSHSYVGSVLIWKDITVLYNEYLLSQKINILYGVFAFLFIEIMLFFAFKKSTIYLEKKVSEQKDKLKTANQFLKNSEISYKTLVESLGDDYFFFIHDNDGFFTYVSPSITNILGYSNEEFLAHYTTYLVPGKDNNKVVEYTDIALEGKRQKPYELEIYHKNGAIHSLLISESPRFNENGEVVGLSGIAKDITISKAEHNQLKAREYTLSKAIEYSPLLIIITNSNYNIEYVNQFFINTTGYIYGDVIGQTIDLFTPSKPADFYSCCQWYGELNIVKKSNQTFWVETSCTPISDGNNSTTHYVIIQKDITERNKFLNELTEAKNTAEKANRAKSKFLASMSHELRTPLNSIIGFSQLFKYDTNLDKKHLDNSEQINSAGQHLLALINDILDLAKIESKQLIMNLEARSLIPVLDECQQLINPLAIKKQVQVHFPENQGEVLVKVDVIRLKQAILNLLSNAVKYSNDSGTIRVFYERVDSGNIKLSVSDDGQGISQENQKQLFEAFNRLDEENGPIEGSGIGLLITKKIIEMMGGEIGFKSEPGKGSTFWLILPFA